MRLDDIATVNSYDFFLRGEEIPSGQRIHVAPMLEERMRAEGVDPSLMKERIHGWIQMGLSSCKWF